MNISLCAGATTNNTWNIDKFMRFQIAYLPDKNLSFENNFSKTQAPLLNPEYAFDINNINLKNFLTLGFDVPKPQHAEQYNYYLKLYDFPKDLQSSNIIEDFFRTFQLQFLPQITELRNYCASKKHLIIKKGLIAKADAKFTRSNSIPPFAYINNDHFNTYFSQHIPFYSLYLTPNDISLNTAIKSLDERAKISTNGVSMFHQNILTAYQNQLTAITGTDNKYYYFLANDNTKNNQTITIIKIPKMILLFPNWRDLPMPHDPTHIFLTSLLLIYSTDYVNKNATAIKKIPPIDSQKFKTIFIRQKTKVLEVGSVVYLTK